MISREKSMKLPDGRASEHELLPTQNFGESIVLLAADL
jgi:hypothetical protein